jgi:hypothetical protein
MNLVNITDFPLAAQIPKVTILADAPMSLALPPRVPVNIMAANTESDDAV